MEIEPLAGDLLRALRGRRSQRAFSRWLGYRTNVAYSWESGRRWPTAAETFRVAQRVGVDVRQALTRFASLPGFDADPGTPDGVAALLRALAGDATLADLGRRSGLGRFKTMRWLSGRTEPRLPEFLRLVDAMTLRLLDFVACFADPSGLPSASSEWERLEARRRLAQEAPWSQAVLRTLELQDYLALPAHRPGWIAHRLGISPTDEADCLARLEQAGQVAWTGTHYAPDEVVAVDSRMQTEAGRTMRRHWLAVADRRIAEGGPGQFSFNVFACSKAELERLREMHLAYFRALRQVVASSQRSEVVAVANLHLFALDAG